MNLYRPALALLAFLTVNQPASAVPEPRYTVRDLGATAGAASRPFGINQSGAICGLNRTNVSGVDVFFAYRTDSGSWSNIGTLGRNYSRPTGIGNGGHIVGSSSNSAGQLRAFLWTPGGTDGVVSNPAMKDLGTLGGNRSEANGVNSHGQATGSARTHTNEQAFFFNGTNLVNIGAVVSNVLKAPWSYGFGVNDHGDVAGVAYNNNFSTQYGFLYSNGLVTTVTTPSTNPVFPLAINNARQITGYASQGGFDNAVRWSGGVATILATPPNHFSYGYAINNKGHVVGTFTPDDQQTNARAFIAIADTIIDLNTLTDSTGTNWVLFEARGINDAGQIVGLGRRNTSTRNFLLQPHPVVEEVAAAGSSFVVRFDAVNRGTYTVESVTSLLSTNWIVSPGAVTGTGASASFTNNTGAAAAYWRLKGGLP